MQLVRTYKRCVFEASAIQEAAAIFAALDRPQPRWMPVSRKVLVGTDEWSFDNDDEFFALYRRGFSRAEYWYSASGSTQKDALRIWVTKEQSVWTQVTAERPSRGELERVLAVFDTAAPNAEIPAPEAPLPDPPTIFLGHGRSRLWVDLKDHLRDLHGYDVVAYETGARSGHTIRDVLESMMDDSTFAVLVMTAEDEQGDGAMRARQNVVHEIGLFQGRLGFDRAIVAVEDGAELFSNLDGIQQLRFGGGNVREIFGDVLATLRREFPGHRA